MPSLNSYAWARLAALAITRGDPDVAELGRDIRFWLQDGCRGDLAAADEVATSGVDIEARTAALAGMAARHCRNSRSRSAAGSRLRAILTAYGNSADWRERDRFAAVNPHEPGTQRADAWDFLRRFRRVPSQDRIRKLLGTASAGAQLLRRDL